VETDVRFRVRCVFPLTFTPQDEATNTAKFVPKNCWVKHYSTMLITNICHRQTTPPKLDCSGNWKVGIPGVFFRFCCTNLTFYLQWNLLRRSLLEYNMCMCGCVCEWQLYWDQHFCADLELVFPPTRKRFFLFFSPIFLHSHFRIFPIENLSIREYRVLTKHRWSTGVDNICLFMNVCIYVLYTYI